MPALWAATWFLGAAITSQFELTPRDLFGGLEARKVVLENGATRLALAIRASFNLARIARE
jgi:hypothetical protein